MTTTRTILITGASAGIGKVTGEALGKTPVTCLTLSGRHAER